MNVELGNLPRIEIEIESIQREVEADSASGGLKKMLTQKERILGL